MSRHYSSSKFVSKLRKDIFKVDKPYALGWGEWGKWETKLKKERPFAYFFTEVLPDIIEWFPNHLIDPIYNVKYKVTNRLQGSHRLDSRLKKGEYHCMDARILHSLFDSFVDFIEIEEANMHVVFADDNVHKEFNVPWWRWWRIFRWKPWRSPEAAIAHLKWEMTLDEPNPDDPHWQSCPHQAISAREKMALYTWWTVIRPARGDSWDESGFRAHWTKMDEKYGEDWLGLGGKGKMNAAEKRAYDKLHQAKDDLEEQWEQEDDVMLTRLIKIRKSLWT